MRRIGTLGRWATVPLALTAACAAIADATGQDPTLGFELAGAAMAAAWLLHIGRRLRQAGAASGQLAGESREAAVDGTLVRLLDTNEPAALVHGMLRPRIYLSPALVRSLDPAELRGVLLHEQHHRTTRAPLRGAALEALECTLGWLPPVRRSVQSRLAALEIEADAAAVAAGIPPATLASALLKCEATAALAAPGFATAAEIRMAELVAWGRTQRATPRPSVPLEWAAPSAGMVALAVCHLLGA